MYVCMHMCVWCVCALKGELTVGPAEMETSDFLLHTGGGDRQLHSSPLVSTKLSVLPQDLCTSPCPCLKCLSVNIPMAASFFIEGYVSLPSPQKASLIFSLPLYSLLCRC